MKTPKPLLPMLGAGGGSLRGTSDAQGLAHIYVDALIVSEDFVTSMTAFCFAVDAALRNSLDAQHAEHGLLPRQHPLSEGATALGHHRTGIECCKL